MRSQLVQAGASFFMKNYDWALIADFSDSDIDVVISPKQLLAVSDVSCHEYYFSWRLHEQFK